MPISESNSINLRDLPIEDLIARADIIIEAMPYISQFRGAVIVIKYGGSAMLEPKLKRAVIQDIALMRLVGMKPVIIHGGGPAINRQLDRMNIQREFVEGQRVTTEETLEVVGMALGAINREIVSDLNQLDALAVGLTGKDNRLITARKLRPPTQDGSDDIDLGYVGEVTRVNPHIIKLLHGDDIIPVIMPLAIGEDGHAYNINADTVASAIAAQMRSDKLILLTETPGILRDRDDRASAIAQLRREEAERLIDDGVIGGGMIPKVRACLNALNSGVGKTHILDGRLPHSLLLELLTDRGIGTLIY